MSWLPWRVRRWLAWSNANWKTPAVMWHFLRGQPRYRILVSTAYFGGVGGTEKHLKSLIESMPDCLFEVFAREVRTNGFKPSTCNYRVNWPIPSGGSYDLYLYFAGGGKPPLECDRFSFKKKLLETNGASVRDIEDRFDFIAVQTGHVGNYCVRHDKCVAAFPDVPATFPRGRTPVDLPERYFLTVFNPFSNALKGNEVLYRAADAASLPIVWCYSDKSGFDFDDLPDHPNIIKLKNLDQPSLYFVYENASAYVSVSHMESFGWSLAEAFYLGLPILAREVGFLTYVREQPGIHLYQDEVGLQALLRRFDYQRARHDDAVFRNNAYPAVIERILS